MARNTKLLTDLALTYGIAFDLYFLVTEQEPSQDNYKAIADICMADIFKHGRMKNLEKVLGKEPKREF